MPAHVGQRFAHDLRYHLALLGRQQVFGPAVRELDANPVHARELIGLAAQVAHESVGPDRPRAQVGERFAYMFEQPLHDVEDVFQSLVRLAFPALHVHLEERDGAREVGRDTVVQIARDTSALARNRPGTQIAVFGDAGHALFVDDAARFNALLGGFIARTVWP